MAFKGCERAEHWSCIYLLKVLTYPSLQLYSNQFDHVCIAGSDLCQSTRQVSGDRNAHKVLECLSYVACMYGEQVILIQYLPCIIDLVGISYTVKSLNYRGTKICILTTMEMFTNT